METEESLYARIVELYASTPQLEALLAGMIDLYAERRVEGLEPLDPDDVSNDLLELCWWGSDDGAFFTIELTRQLVLGPPQRVVRFTLRARYAGEDVEAPSEGNEVCDSVQGVALFRQLLQWSPEIQALSGLEPLSVEIVTEGR